MVHMKKLHTRTSARATALPVPTVHDRIRAAEKALLSGGTERVLVSESDLEKIASLIADTGSTKAQLLKKAVRLGLAVMLLGPAAIPRPTLPTHEESLGDLPTVDPAQYLGGWKRPDPIPYAGFMPTEAASHYMAEGPSHLLAPKPTTELVANGDGGFIDLEDSEAQ